MSRRNSRVIETQLKQIDAIFRAHSADPPVIKLLEVKKDRNCDIHGLSTSRRGSTDSGKNLSRKGSNASNGETKRSSEKLNESYKKKNRNSIASFTELVERSVTPNGNGFKRDALDREMYNRPRRDSMPIIDNGKLSVARKGSHDTWNAKLFKGMEHPSDFPHMLRSSSQSLNSKNAPEPTNAKSSSSWNVNHFHKYGGNGKDSNLDKKLSLSTSEKIYKRDFANGSTGSSPEPKKELHSILKHRKADEDDLKEIIKRLSFDYIEKEMSQNDNKIELDLMSNSDSSSGGAGRRTPITSLKSTVPRRVSIDSLDSRRGSRRLSDFSSDADDDIVTRDRLIKSSPSPVSASSVNKLRIRVDSRRFLLNRNSDTSVRTHRATPLLGLSCSYSLCNMRFRKSAMSVAASKLSWEEYRGSSSKLFENKKDREKNCFFISRSPRALFGSISKYLIILIAGFQQIVFKCFDVERKSFASPFPLIQKKLVEVSPAQWNLGWRLRRCLRLRTNQEFQCVATTRIQIFITAPLSRKCLRRKLN